MPPVRFQGAYTKVPVPLAVKAIDPAEALERPNAARMITLGNPLRLYRKTHLQLDRQYAVAEPCAKTNRKTSFQAKKLSPCGFAPFAAVDVFRDMVGLPAARRTLRGGWKDWPLTSRRHGMRN